MFYDLFFDKEFAKVNRMIRDTHPYQIVRGEGKDTIIINALGVNEDDFEIEIKPNRYDERTTYLCIKGETENAITETKYSIENRFTINKLKVKEIKYYAKDGLLYIDVYYIDEPAVDIPIYKGGSDIPESL